MLDGGTLAAPDSGATVVVLSGDVPLVSAEAIRGLVQTHAQGDAPATMVSTCAARTSSAKRVARNATSMRSS